MKRSHLILIALLAAAVLIFAGICFVRSIQGARETSKCGFKVAEGESTITIRNGTVAKLGNTSIGASVGSDDSFNLTFLNGTNEQKFTVKECDTFDYRTNAGILSVKVSKISPNTNWWGTVPGSNTASVELIIQQ